ncbi:recombinase family protein [Paracoccus jeotgali]|nr:recombinase family protein [Paracoccus jeotgali]
MTNLRIGYARCSTDAQDLAAQRAALEILSVASERIYTDHGLTGRNRDRAWACPGAGRRARGRHACGAQA